MKTLCSLLVPILALGLGCAHHEHPDNPPDRREARRLPAALQADADTLVQGNTAFACDLYGRLKGADGNLFLSPFSLSEGLAMTWAGARGATESGMAQAMHFTLSQDRLHPAFGALQKSLDTGAGFGGYRLNIANRLFGQRGFPWLAPFLTVTREQYGAQLQELDFTASPEPSRQAINQWVSERTMGAVQDLLPTGSVGSDTRLVLANAIYFKGRWESRFDTASTRDGVFQRPGMSSVHIPFMHQTRDFPHAHVEDLTVLELPYEGKDIAMVLLLPDRVDGLPALEARLDAPNLSRWLGSLRTSEVFVSMPRITIRSAFDLEPHLAAQGMAAAFSDTADFSGMDGRLDLRISSVFHKTCLEVNEEGTVAAAATGVVIGPTAVAPVTLDHPFLLLIMDKVTGSVLFMGRVADPSRT